MRTVRLSVAAAAIGGVAAAFGATPAQAYCDRPSYFHIPGQMIQWDAPSDCDWRHTYYDPRFAGPSARAMPRHARRAYASSPRHKRKHR